MNIIEELSALKQRFDASLANHHDALQKVGEFVGAIPHAAIAEAEKLKADYDKIRDEYDALKSEYSGVLEKTATFAEESTAFINSLLPPAQPAPVVQPVLPPQGAAPAPVA